MPWPLGKARVLDPRCQLCGLNRPWAAFSVQGFSHYRFNDRLLAAAYKRLALCRECTTKVVEGDEEVSTRMGLWIAEGLKNAAIRIKLKIESQT
jgi:hypothetical protein